MSSVVLQGINVSARSARTTLFHRRPTLAKVRWERLVAEHVFLSLPQLFHRGQDHLSRNWWAGACCFSTGLAFHKGPALRKVRWNGLLLYHIVQCAECALLQED